MNFGEEESEKEEQYVKEPIPTGDYCGDYLGEVQVKVSVVSLTDVKLTGTVFGSAVSCPAEIVAYDQTSHVVKFPNIQIASDCLGALLKSYSIDPTTLAVTYDPAQNTVNVNAMGITFSLTKCTSAIMYKMLKNSWKAAQ